MLLAVVQGLQSSTHNKPLNPALFHRKNKPKNLPVFKGYSSTNLNQIPIPKESKLFPK